MTRHLTQSGLHLPLVRKVICRDEHYICSICRSEYQSKTEANQCLNYCWFEAQQLYPVVLRKLQGRYIVFRCHFCCRDYQEESDALTCAKRCLNDRNNLHIKEQLLNDLPLEAPVKRPSRLKLVPMQTAPVKNILSRKKPNTASSSHSSQEVNTVESDALDSSPLVEAPPRKSMKDFPKHWVRMNEKYQCRYCNSLFYTKMEAEACFTGHFGEDGFEKDPAKDL